MDPDKARRGMILTTSVGNYVVRLERPVEPGSDYDSDLANLFESTTWDVPPDVSWHVTVLFDASCRRMPPFDDAFLIKGLEPFDALRLGLVFNQLFFLKDELDRWAESPTTTGSDPAT